MLLLALNSQFEAFIQLITLIIIFAAVLFLTFFVTKIFGGFQKEKMTGSNISIIETIRISSSKYIQIVKIADKTIAIAVTKDNVSFLCELNEDSIVEPVTAAYMQSDSFKEILDKFRLGGHKK